MRNRVIWIALLLVLAGLLLVMIANSRPEAEGADAGSPPPHSLVAD